MNTCYLDRLAHPSDYSPVFIIDLEKTHSKIFGLRAALSESNVSLLYSMKALSLQPVVSDLCKLMDGVSISSAFEARLAKELSSPNKTINFVGVLRNKNEISVLAELCNCITFNSLSQWTLWHNILLTSPIHAGIRVNTHLSIVDDPRYDPCRMYSKLGVSIKSVEREWREGNLRSISGIHFHTACECTSWEPLLQAVKTIEKQLSPMMHELEWINLGGGYEWDETTDFGPLQESVDLLSNKYGLDVFLEPGNGIVNSAGSLHVSVVDLFESDGKMIAILDSSVNHLPQVFEYQFEPDVAQHLYGAPYKYILAGCSCLAGDIFGEYSFEEPLDIGSRITFENVGAYSIVKANMFNGINLPSIYCQHEDGHLELVREFTYEDYLARCGGESYATLPTRV